MNKIELARKIITFHEDVGKPYGIELVGYELAQAVLEDDKKHYCQGAAHAGCNYLATCGTVCNKCGQFVG